MNSSEGLKAYGKGTGSNCGRWERARCPGGSHAGFTDEMGCISWTICHFGAFFARFGAEEGSFFFYTQSIKTSSGRKRGIYVGRDTDQTMRPHFSGDQNRQPLSLPIWGCTGAAAGSAGTEPADSAQRTVPAAPLLAEPPGTAVSVSAQSAGTGSKGGRRRPGCWRRQGIPPGAAGRVWGS